MIIRCNPTQYISICHLDLNSCFFIFLPPFMESQPMLLLFATERPPLTWPDKPPSPPRPPKRGTSAERRCSFCSNCNAFNSAFSPSNWAWEAPAKCVWDLYNKMCFSLLHFVKSHFLPSEVNKNKNKTVIHIQKKSHPVMSRSKNKQKNMHILPKTPGFSPVFLRDLEAFEPFFEEGRLLSGQLQALAGRWAKGGNNKNQGLRAQL